MKKDKNKNNRGFSTLFVVILLGSAILSFALAISTSNFWSIQRSTAAKNSIQGKALVNACAEIALENIRQNNSYAGTNNITLNNNSCDYTVTNNGGASKKIIVSGTINTVISKLTIITNSFNPLTISSWLETQ